MFFKEKAIVSSGLFPFFIAISILVVSPFKFLLPAAKPDLNLTLFLSKLLVLGFIASNTSNLVPVIIVEFPTIVSSLPLLNWSIGRYSVISKKLLLSKVTFNLLSFCIIFPPLVKIGDIILLTISCISK